MFGLLHPYHSHWRHHRHWRRMGMGRLLLGLLFAPLILKRAMRWHGGYDGYGRYGWHDGWHEGGHGGCPGWRGGWREWRGGPREWRGGWHGGPREWRGPRGPHGPDYV